MGGGALAAVAVDVGTEVAMETVGVMENHARKTDFWNSDRTAALRPGGFTNSAGVFR